MSLGQRRRAESAQVRRSSACHPGRKASRCRRTVSGTHAQDAAAIGRVGRYEFSGEGHVASRWKIAVFSGLLAASLSGVAYWQIDSRSHQTDVATVARPGLEVHLWVSSPKAEVSLNVSVTAQSGRKVAAVYAQTNPVTDVLVAVPKPVPYFDSSFKELDTFVPSPGDNDPIPPPPQHYYELTEALRFQLIRMHSGTCSGNFRCRPVRCPGHRTY